MDVGAWLKAELRAWWAEEHAGELLTVKYIDLYMAKRPEAHGGTRPDTVRPAQARSSIGGPCLGRILGPMDASRYGPIIPTQSA